MEQPTAQTNAAPTHLSQAPRSRLPLGLWPQGQRTKFGLDPGTPVPWTIGDIFLAMIVGVAVLLGMVPLASAALHLLDAEWTKHLTGMLVSVAELGLLLPIWLFGVHKYHVSWRHVGFRRFDVSRGLSLGCLFQRVASANDRFYLSRLDQFFEVHQIFGPCVCRPEYYLLAACH